MVGRLHQRWSALRAATISSSGIAAGGGGGPNRVISATGDCSGRHPGCGGRPLPCRGSSVGGLNSSVGFRLAAWVCFIPSRAGCSFILTRYS